MAVVGSGTEAAVHVLAARAAGFGVSAVAGDDGASVQRLAADARARVATIDDVADGASAVVVASPPAERCHDTRRLLDASVPLLVDSPVATTLGEADALVAAEHGGAQVLLGENLLQAPVVRRTLAILGRLGDLRFLEVRALASRPVDAASTRGGGALLQLGVHPVALALALAGPVPVTAVRAVVDSAPGEAFDDHAELELRFTTGLTARVEASWRHPEAVWDLQASSDTGVVRADLLPHVGLEHDGEPVTLPAAPADVEPHLLQLGYVDQIRLLLGDASSPTDGARTGRDVLEVVCAAYASAASGAPVPLPFTGPRDVEPAAFWRS